MKANDSVGKMPRVVEVGVRSSDVAVASGDGRWVPGVDGLRALAVLGVVAFHDDSAVARGGFLGVDLFFVISGFLITRLLLSELESTGYVSLLGFYKRRALRILPVMLMVMAGTAIAASMFARDALDMLRADAIPSILFYANWHYIFQNLSYFQEIGRPPLLQHLWSLAIEEQFYLLWPVVLLALARLGGRRLIVIVTCVLACSAAFWMLGLATVEASLDKPDLSRAYFGTDSHSIGLFAGAALAAAAVPTRPAQSLAWRILLGLAGFAGIAGITVLFRLVHENAGWLYPWGFLSCVGCALAALYACLSLPTFGRMLDFAPVRWIGRRSYGIYLWHWPVFLLTRPGVDLYASSGATTVIRFSLTLLLAELSYQTIEIPMQRRKGVSLIVSRQFAAGALSAFTLAGLMVLGFDREIVSTGSVDSYVKAAVGPGEVTLETDRSAASSERVSSVRHAAQLTVLGDSVVLGARSVIEQEIHGATVIATVGWQAADIVKALDHIRQSGDLHPRVLLHLGTNGYVNEKQFRYLLDALRDRESVLVVNTRVPRRWMNENNEMMSALLAEYPNGRLVDWRAVSEGHPEYFVSDGVHLTSAGMRAFVGAIVEAGSFEKYNFPDPAPKAPLGPIFPQATDPQDYAPTLVRNARPIAPLSFWELIASCESGNNWQNGGQFSGGLGIFIGSWREFGGSEFGPTPDRASYLQQIEIANRISTKGWNRPDGQFVKPVGFTGWGCLRTVGRPRLMMFTEDSLLATRFRWMQRGQAVRDLQSLLGVAVDGIYGEPTRHRHREMLEQRGLPAGFSGIVPRPESSPEGESEPIPRDTGETQVPAKAAD